MERRLSTVLSEVRGDADRAESRRQEENRKRQDAEATLQRAHQELGELRTELSVRRATRHSTTTITALQLGADSQPSQSAEPVASPAQATTAPALLTDAVFDALDRNQDGVLSPQELEPAASAEVEVTLAGHRSPAVSVTSSPPVPLGFITPRQCMSLTPPHSRPARQTLCLPTGAGPALLQGAPVMLQEEPPVLQQAVHRPTLLPGSGFGAMAARVCEPVAVPLAAVQGTVMTAAPPWGPG